VTRPRPPAGAAGRRLAWVVAAAVLLGALVVTGRLLGTGGPARAPAATASSAPQPPPRPGVAGTVQVEGVPLAPTGASFRASCRRAAERLGFAVPCPRLLPVPASGPAPPGVCQDGGSCGSGLLWFAMDGFVVPAGFTGAPGSLGAMVILATPDPRAAAGMERWCPDQRPAAGAAPGGGAAVLAACPAGYQGWSEPSMVLRWSGRGAFVTLGLRGRSEGNRRLLVSLARGVQLVGG
jgi:hypothetical protein